MATIDKLIVEVGADIKELQKKLKTIEKEVGGVDKAVKKNAGSWDTLKKGIAAAMVAAPIVAFGKSIVTTIANFQKLEAVLTNTLGSSSAAQGAMDMIVDFASKTPFAVEELTSSFVKLANQGFKPTKDEMRSLGDLAASTGKDFDMLAEAVIDAQVGEFERLKEFGIRASKSGDQVKFTFKGVETQVKATEANIRDYITSLGDAEGVSGAMAAISETLEGKFSNLGDSWDQFALSLDSGAGIVSKSVGAVTDALGNMLSNLTAINNSDLSWWRQIGALAGGVSKTIIDTQNAMSSLVSSSTNMSELKNNAAKNLKILNVQFKEGGLSAEEYKTAVETLKSKIQQTAAGFEPVKKQVTTTTKAYRELLKEVDKVAGKDMLPAFSQPVNMELATPQQGTGNPYADMVSNAQVASEAIGYYSDAAQLKLDELGYKTAGVAEGINIGFSGIASVISEQLGLAAGSMASFVQAVSGTFLQIIAKALSVAMANAITGATGAAAVAGPFAPAVLPATIATMTGTVLSAFASIPMMADGGMFFGESLAMVGEGRGTSLTNPEVVAPLDKLKSFMQPQAGGLQNVRFELEGQKLVGVMNRYEKQNRY